MGFTVADSIQPRQMSSRPAGISARWCSVGMRPPPSLSWSLAGHHIVIEGAHPTCLPACTHPFTPHPSWRWDPLGISPHDLSPTRRGCGVPYSLLCSPYMEHSCVSSQSFAPLDRVICHSAIASFGLLRTVSHSASQMMAEFLPVQFQLRQRAVEYYLWRLTYART